jgi:predicted aspartyl protease
MISRSRTGSKRKQDDMGRIVIEVALQNHEDVILSQAGVLAPEKIRRATIAGVVDTGATRLVLPQTVVRELGLRISGEAPVRYADQRVTKRKLVSDVQLKLLDRESIFSAVVEPRRKHALIGAIVLEELDLIVDCTRQRLIPRDPEGILSEIE